MQIENWKSDRMAWWVIECKPQCVRQACRCSVVTLERRDQVEVRAYAQRRCSKKSEHDEASIVRTWNIQKRWDSEKTSQTLVAFLGFVRVAQEQLNIGSCHVVDMGRWRHLDWQCSHRTHLATRSHIRLNLDRIQNLVDQAGTSVNHNYLAKGSYTFPSSESVIQVGTLAELAAMSEINHKERESENSRSRVVRHAGFEHFLVRKGNCSLPYWPAQRADFGDSC